MNRTIFFKIAYFCIISLTLPIIFYLTKGNLSISTLLLLTLVCLIPGRLAGYFWRDLIVGRRLMNRENWSESVPHLVRFIRKMRQHQWLNILIWFNPSLYTTSALAMGLNNLGVAYLRLGEIDEAQRHLLEALKIDQLYPMPHYNLAIIEFLRGNMYQGEHHLAESKRLGFTGGKIDRALDYVKTIRAGI